MLIIEMLEMLLKAMLLPEKQIGVEWKLLKAGFETKKNAQLSHFLGRGYHVSAVLSMKEFLRLSIKVFHSMDSMLSNNFYVL